MPHWTQRLPSQVLIGGCHYCKIVVVVLIQFLLAVGVGFALPKGHVPDFVVAAAVAGQQHDAMTHHPPASSPPPKKKMMMTYYSANNAVPH